jgi:filamentous hemagglutinin
MTRVLICVLALLFSMSGPAMEGKADFQHSSFAAKNTTALDWSIVSKAGETRAAHVTAQHGALNLQKPVQGVFYGNPVNTLDNAWAIAQQQGIRPITSGGVDIYVVPRPNSGFAGGYLGQGQNLNTVTILTQPGTPKIITGYPGNGTPLPYP